jgi:hypothetical protein
MIRRWLPALVVCAVGILAGCSEPSRLSDNTLPPLQSGPFSPPPTSAGPSTTALGGSTTTASGGLPGTTLQPAAGTWGGWPYYEVPQLGSESVRGTGCGSTGGIPEVIPDGVWNVLVGDGSGRDEFFTASDITVDMRCIYSGVGGQQLWNAACTAAPQSDSCRNNSPDWYVVNANGRLRTMPLAPDLQYGVGALGTSPCPSAPTDRTARDAPWRSMDSWIVVSGGRVTAMVTACPAG